MIGSACSDFSCPRRVLMQGLILILGSVVVAGIIALTLKAALRLPQLPPQLEIGGYALILLMCLLIVFGLCGP